MSIFKRRQFIVNVKTVNIEKKKMYLYINEKHS